MRRGVWALLVIGYGFAFLRAMHRASFLAWQAACFAWVLVIVIGYCLEANGIPLRHGLTPAHSWDLRLWPVANRQFFFTMVMVAGLVTVLLSLAGFLTGR
ncbi:MAG: hypothetical protein IJU65_07950 [Desulfovibrio sp.]|nr:hypothetical protein [Desulfovibrio sp.]